MNWFDAHLDLAYLAECGRDMLATLDPGASPHAPAAITIPSLCDGGIAACLGTIFTEAFHPDKPAYFMQVAYPIGDTEGAHAAGLRQLERYRAWRASGTIGPLPDRRASLRLGILVECADPIRSPDELPWWAERGVVAVGMSWVHGSRYSGGNGPSGDGVGITKIGRDFVQAMDALDLVHDVSHLSQRALDDLLSLTDRPVIASHSNCRALIDGKNARHLPDDAIREIGRRGGVIGLNLYSPFLRAGLTYDRPGRASIDDSVRHIEHIAALHGHGRGIGLGSDMDGGFGADRLPAGIDVPADLEKLAGALTARGWSDERVDAFAWGNWARFFGL
jgi:membrane dipeptidase